MKKETKRKIGFGATIIVSIIVLIILIPSVDEALQYDNETWYCETTYCSKYNLEEFDSCVDIGLEGCGLFCSNHYHLCDGNKIIKKCIEYDKKEIGEGFIYRYYGNLECSDIRDTGGTGK